MEASNLFAIIPRSLAALAFILSIVPARAQTPAHYKILKSLGPATTDCWGTAGRVVPASDGFLYGVSSSGGISNAGALFRLGTNGADYSFVRSFTFDAGDTPRPNGELLEATDGLLYGTSGDIFFPGAIYRISKDGLQFRVIHTFTTNGTDGFNPSGLMQASDHRLYGVTVQGPNPSVFRLSLDGSNFEVIHHFVGGPNDGASPVPKLSEGTNGLLYGTASAGGMNNAGVVFRLDKTGNNYSIIQDFGSPGHSNQSPRGISWGSDGNLYGTTSSDPNSGGTLFGMNSDGGEFHLLHAFGSIADPGGAQPAVQLIEGQDGLLYGTTYFGGAGSVNGGVWGVGTVFKITKDGSIFTQLLSFGTNPGDGYYPTAGVVQSKDGTIYGTAGTGPASVFRISTNGSDYHVLRHFVGTSGGGTLPGTEMTEGSDGLLYGTTVNSTGGNGTIFRLLKDGSGYDVICTFSAYFNNGQSPYGGVIEASDHLLYGTTAYGGSNSAGTLYRLKKDGSDYQVIHHFSAGSYPAGRLIEASDGFLYGAGWYGGVFTIRKDGASFATLHSFTAPGDGYFCQSGVMEASNGNLYGTTYHGGSNNVGTVFRLDKNGNNYQVLHRFETNGVDGQLPRAGLLEASDGALYSTTEAGGAFGFGTVFRINKDGNGYAIIHDFGTNASGCTTPYSGVVEGADGALYGTGANGGSNFGGAVFRLNKDGSQFKVLHAFPGDPSDGVGPWAKLIIGRDGAFYGTTAGGGGTGNQGVVFQLWPPQTPDMLDITGPSNARQIRFAGSGGSSYKVLRSTNFSFWSVIDSLIMPMSGVATNIDNAALPSAFYRAAWVP